MTKKKVIIFVGEDVTAHLITNKVVESIIANDEYAPELYFVKHPPSNKANHPLLKQFAFHERSLLNDTVYPFINNNPCISARNVSPQQLSERHGIAIHRVMNVNDPLFVSEMSMRDDIACALSIRCFQIFKKEIIQAVKKTAPFLNLHPGLLPEYRGVMSTVRRMHDIVIGASDTNEYGCTLHKIDEGIDTGKLIEVRSLKLPMRATAFGAQVGLVEAGSDLIQSVLQQLNKYTIRGYPQSDTTSAYYSFPDDKELRQWENAGIRLFDTSETISTLVDAFSKANTPHAQKLEKKLTSAVKAWYVANGYDKNGSSLSSEKSQASSSARQSGLSGFIQPQFS